MPLWRFAVGCLLIAVGSIVGLPLTLAPELELLRSAPTKRGAWVPSVVLQAATGLALGCAAYVQQSRGAPRQEQIALGAFIGILAVWLFLAGILGHFDRTIRDGRRVFRACLALPTCLSGRTVRGRPAPFRQAQLRLNWAATIRMRHSKTWSVEQPQNNRMRLTAPLGAARA